jgi:hypothetical protein
MNSFKGNLKTENGRVVEALLGASDCIALCDEGRDWQKQRFLQCSLAMFSALVTYVVLIFQDRSKICRG